MSIVQSLRLRRAKLQWVKRNGVRNMRDLITVLKRCNMVKVKKQKPVCPRCGLKRDHRWGVLFCDVTRWNPNFKKEKSNES